jgi:hypothetical protein
MLQAEFFDRLRFRLAESSVGDTALRNQGAPRVIAPARLFLKGLELSSFALSQESRFLDRLDAATDTLQRAFPPRCSALGTTRKALNPFLRDVVYYVDVASHYRLEAIRGWLEVPLDSYVARGLRRYPDLSDGLPSWRAIKFLTPQTSEKYQRVASLVARKEGLARVDLDVIFWRADSVRPTAR